MPNPIEEDHKLARAVGVLAGRWGLVEFYIELIFVVLVGTTERKATILFSFFKGVGTQCDIIAHLVDESPTLTDETRERIKAILKSYRDLAPERNGVIHYPFGWETVGETQSLYKTARARKGPDLTFKKPTSAEAVMLLADKVDALMNQIAVLISSDWWQPASSLQTLPEQFEGQTLGMLSALQEHFQSPSEEPSPHLEPSGA